MFYVGIDVAKYKHDFAIINEHGLVIVPPKTIQNSQEGFNELLSSLDRSQEIKIGLEATGQYMELTNNPSTNHLVTMVLLEHKI